MSAPTIHPLLINKEFHPESWTFDHRQIGPLGVGRDGHLILGFDKYFNVEAFDELHDEVCVGLAKCRDTSFGKVLGPLPPQYQAQLKSTFPEDMLTQLDRYDPSGKHRKVLNTFTDWESRWRYMCFAMGAVIPWFFSVYLRESRFIEKTTQSSHASPWTPESRHFPKLVKFIETELPFASIGRVLFFTSYPGADVPVHRDFVVEPHKDHNINFFFDGWRPSFIFNEITGEKTYLEKGQRSYFFNNRDYHGVDAEPKFRYTLRIDGTFNDKLQQELSLEDGNVFKWEYPKGQALLSALNHGRKN